MDTEPLFSKNKLWSDQELKGRAITHLLKLRPANISLSICISDDDDDDAEQKATLDCRCFAVRFGRLQVYKNVVI